MLTKYLRGFCGQIRKPSCTCTTRNICFANFFFIIVSLESMKISNCMVYFLYIHTSTFSRIGWTWSWTSSTTTETRQVSVILLCNEFRLVSTSC